MRIRCTNTGKRFNRDWIFRNINYEFAAGGKYAVIGPNGSGKSTLLQVIAGAVVSSRGSIEYLINDTPIDKDEVFKQVAIAAPSLEVIEELTLLEFLEFHTNFKPLVPGIHIKDIAGIIKLEKSAGKQIRYYSSGMKQRVKLAQAIFSDTPCLLLDEPCTNLDEQGIALYHSLVHNYCNNRLVIVSSNDPQEYSFCENLINLMQYK